MAERTQRPGRRDWLLGIDTSSDLVSVALLPVAEDVEPGGAELSWDADRNQTATLLAQIERLHDLCGLEPEVLSGVVVATGPGGFNALRVGMSVAKGLCLALDIPIFGVGTLDALAHAAACWGLPVRAVVPAGRGRVVVADYRVVAGQLRQQDAMTHRSPRQLAADLLAPTVLTGDLPAADAVWLRQQPNVVLPGAALRRRRAAVLIDLALPRWLAGEPDDLVTLEPLYLHRAVERAGSDTGA